MKRQWTNIQGMEWRIIELRNEGRTRQEIADELGLNKVQIKNWINRYNRSTAKLEAGLIPKKCGRSRTRELSPQEAQAYEIKRLRMENALLRDFLHLAGRR